MFRRARFASALWPRRLFIVLLAVLAISETAQAQRVDMAVRRAGRWQLELIRDRFSDDTRCRLFAMRHDAFYLGDALAFDLRGSADVMAAWLRIDGGAPARWRDMLPELARLRVPIGGRDLARPTDGLVWVPAAMLANAHSVTIQPGFGKRPTTFLLEGFATLRQQATDLGCTARARFVR